jgi:anti-sigma factor RsiW
MTCPEARNMISLYIDDELLPDERQGFVAHIETCQACREELTETEQLHGLFVVAPRFDAPLGFAPRVLAQVDKKKERWFGHLWQSLSSQPFFLRTAQIAFALVIVIIGALSGSLLTTARTTEALPTVRESFSLDLFKATPPDSVGGVYMRLVGVANER